MRRSAAAGLAVLLGGLLAGGCAAPRAPGPASAPTLPASSGADVNDGDGAFRVHPPAPEQPVDFVVPVPRETILANGMRLWMIERRSARLIGATLVLRGGSAAFPDQPAAVTEFATLALSNGTATRNAGEIYDKMSVDFFELGTSVADSSVRLSAVAAPTSFDQALEVMSDVALHPTFAASRIDLLRQQRMNALPKTLDDPVRAASRNFFGAFYGPGHPCVRTAFTDADQLAAIKRDDVVRTWRALMDPTQAILIINGRFSDSAAIVARVQALFGDWQRDPAATARAPIPPLSPTKARLIVVDRPGATQATVFFGSSVPGIAAPGHLAEFVARQLIGQQASPALANKIRDQLGAVWASVAYQHLDRVGGISWWQGSVAAERTAALLSTLEQRLRELHDQGPTAAELAAIKSWMTQDQPRRLETTKGMATSFADTAAIDMPKDDEATLGARLATITIADVQAQTPDPMAMKAVVVGDLHLLRASLQDLGWGPIEEHDKAGKFLRTLSR